ncbi:hypothetical protein [Bhargavaea changchunensis]|uniref:hypothetical protein n=1 Tax=Bhargavaea changchunensis TaxID=2134037 RepID=UPI00366B9EAE
MTGTGIMTDGGAMTTAGIGIGIGTGATMTIMIGTGGGIGAVGADTKNLYSGLRAA